MAVSHEQLPRDGNGIVQGAYRIVHADPTYHGPIGVYDLVDGASTSPACGRALVCAIGEYGPHLYLEPWGPLPSGFQMPEMVGADVPDGVTFEPCPWRGIVAPVVAERLVEAAKPEPTDDIDTMGLEDLRAFAELHGIAVDGRWGAAKIREAIRANGDA